MKKATLFVSDKSFKQVLVVTGGKCQCNTFLKCLIWCDFSEEDMYRDAEEIEKEKELLTHEKGLSGMFGIILFIQFLLFIVGNAVGRYGPFHKMLGCAS